MKVIIHMKPDFTETHVRTLVYSVKYKKYPKCWDTYNCDYFVLRGKFTVRKDYILDFMVENLYEATHKIPNCEDCEFVQEEDCYCETYRMAMEDWD